MGWLGWNPDSTLHVYQQKPVPYLRSLQEMHEFVKTHFSPFYFLRDAISIDPALVSL